MIIRLINKLMFTRKRVNAARQIAIGFMILILSGTLLLMLPISSQSGEITPFITALFTATSATCVTGLIVVETGAYYSYFGQAIILMLIQIGGLGFMMILTTAYLASKRQIGLKNRMIIAHSMGLNSMSGVVRIAKHTITATIIIEGTGALLLSIKFVQEYGLWNGIWYGVFTSVSAFCNAGFDVFGDGMSLIRYRQDPFVLIVISLLIIIGGLGFFVWEDMITKRRKMTVYSKIVLIMTALLITIGTAGFLIFEYSNHNTVGSNDIVTKILNSYFQAVTTRTAGFDSMGQSNLTEASKYFSIILMMIGGASGSTAGGIKVATFTVILLTIISVLRGKNNVTVMNRTIPSVNIIHGLAILGLWLIMTSVSGVIISCLEDLPLLNCIYETASAYDTVGLTCGVTAHIGQLSSIIMIILMYFGRVGIMTIGLTFISSQNNNNKINYPSANILIG